MAEQEEPQDVEKAEATADAEEGGEEDDDDDDDEPEDLMIMPEGLGMAIMWIMEKIMETTIAYRV